MKVYIQEMNGQNCVFNSINGIIASVEMEVDYCDECENLSVEQREKIVDEIVDKIKELNTGEKIEKLGFNWKVEEMPKEEYEGLEEFDGF